MTQFVDDLLNVVGSDVDEEQVDRPGGSHEADLGALDPDGATLEVAVPEDVQILAVSRALRQLLENLLANAVDHGGTGVTVEVGLTEAGFYVEDDGPGIPTDDRGRIFEHCFTTGGPASDSSSPRRSQNATAGSHT